MIWIAPMAEPGTPASAVIAPTRSAGRIPARRPPPTKRRTHPPPGARPGRGGSRSPGGGLGSLPGAAPRRRGRTLPGPRRGAAGRAHGPRWPVLRQERRRDLRLRLVARLARVEEGDGGQGDLHRVVLVGEGLDHRPVAVEVGRDRARAIADGRAIASARTIVTAFVPGLCPALVLVFVPGQALAEARPQELEPPFAQVGDRRDGGPLEPRPRRRLDVERGDGARAARRG